MFDNIYILIPVYNEEKKIESVITELSSLFKNIVAINDGSTDSTQDILESLNVITLKHSINLGQGAAISTGFKYIQQLKNADAIVTFDADGQHSVEDAKTFAEEILLCKEEIIFGTRFKQSRSNIPLIKKIVLSIVVIFTNKLSKINLSDAHNGLKALKKTCLKKIDINIDGFGFESQIIHQVSKKGIRYKEMPTNTIYTSYSQNKGQKLSNGLIILEDLFKSSSKNDF
jgi:glycosyltransferase involved in cell wall biosynthesis|tara:strand:- start:145 stop:831 length:687 start_codon:yes stop_codon:yes gene_type:complete